MNFNEIDKILGKNNLTMNDVMKMANQFSKKNLNDENELREVIKDLSKMLGKSLSHDEEDKMIQMVKNRDVKL